MRIKKCGLAFSAKMKVGHRRAAAEAPSLGVKIKYFVNIHPIVRKLFLIYKSDIHNRKAGR